MQARLDKPYKCETKPAVIAYLERALTGKMTEIELNETELPEKHLNALKSINKQAKFPNGMLSLKLLPTPSDCTLSTLTIKDGDKTEELVNDSKLLTDILAYLSIMSEVMCNYITKVVEMIRSNSGVQVPQIMHNQSRYIQVAYLANSTEFTLSSLTDIDLYSYATSANIENVLIVQPFLRKIKIADYLRMVPYKNGETITYTIQSVGLTSRSIYPMNGARLRLIVRGDGVSSRELDLGFLGEDEEEI